MSDKRILKCHCGAVEVEIKFDNKLENIRRCDCSLCRPIFKLNILGTPANKWDKNNASITERH